MYKSYFISSQQTLLGFTVLLFRTIVGFNILLVLGTEFNSLRQEVEFSIHLDKAIEASNRLTYFPSPFSVPATKKKFSQALQKVNDYIFSLITKTRERPQSELRNRTGTFCKTPKTNSLLALVTTPHSFLSAHLSRCPRNTSCVKRF